MLKCQICGFGIIFDHKEPLVKCPKCKAAYTVLKEDDEYSLEPVLGPL